MGVLENPCGHHTPFRKKIHLRHLDSSTAVYEVSSQAPFRHLIAFSIHAQTVRARDQASCPPRRCLHPRFDCWRNHHVGWRRVRPKRYARTTVYPCDACHGATTPYLVRAKRTGRPIKSRPIERTVSSRITRRHNGDSHRLASPLPIAAFTLQTFLRLRFRLGSCNSHHRGGRLLGMTPSRRTHVQPPILLHGSLGHLTLIHQTPQRD